MDGNFYQINHIRQIPIARVSKFKSIHLVPKTMYFLKFTFSDRNVHFSALVTKRRILKLLGRGKGRRK